MEVGAPSTARSTPNVTSIATVTASLSALPSRNFGLSYRSRGCRRHRRWGPAAAALAAVTVAAAVPRTTAMVCNATAEIQFFYTNIRVFLVRAASRGRSRRKRKGSFAWLRSSRGARGGTAGGECSREELKAAPKTKVKRGRVGARVQPKCRQLTSTTGHAGGRVTAPPPLLISLYCSRPLPTSERRASRSCRGGA